MNLGVFRRKVDVDADIQMTPLKSLYASGDKDAHVFELSLYRGEQEMDLSGASAQGYFIRADGYTVPITGTISGNVLTLTLSEGCYYVVGNFNLIIKVSTAESRKSVFWGNGYVVRSMTDAIVDEENVIPSLDELLAQIAAAESAAKAANQAASAANSAATSAAQAASAANANASKANSAANSATAAASAASAAATKIDDMTISATGLAAGAAPTAELTEVDGHYSIVLGIPKGDKGDPGATPQITVQVKTGEPGTAASVKQTGTAEAPVIELTIPRGDTGSLGSLTINGKTPDGAGKVMLTAADVGALSGTDATLTQEGKAADAKATGDELNQLKSDIDPLLYDNAGAHNAIYRGKNLGASVTAAQWASIKAGTFGDLYIGDYWTIGGVTYRIAAFDYYLRAGDTDMTTHHVTLVPDASMYSHVMNDTNVTTGGYVGSKMYTTGLADAKTTINNAFGSAHILTHRRCLCNAVSGGKPSGVSWYDSTVDLMTELNVYGSKVFGVCNTGSAVPILYTVDKSQYPLFAFRPDLISNRVSFWLRDVSSSSTFAYVSNNGRAAYLNASETGGVRPAFSIMT